MNRSAWLIGSVVGLLCGCGPELGEELLGQAASPVVTAPSEPPTPYGGITTGTGWQPAPDTDRLCRSSACVYLYYDSPLDANELWRVEPNGSQSLLKADLTSFDRYTQRYHKELAVAVNPGSRYSFVYNENQLPISSSPSNYRLVRSPAFAARVSRLGTGFQLLRETLFVFGTWSWPAYRFEQVYRGQDSQLYVYRPAVEGQAAYGPVLLSRLMAEGYGVYDLTDFQP
jgi:hypothetical protein